MSVFVWIPVTLPQPRPVRTRLVFLHTYPRPHTWKQFTSFTNISDLSLVRCFVPKSEEFVSDRIFSTISFLLRTASWSRGALPCPSPFCLLWTVLHWSQCAAELERLYPGLWQTPEPPSTLLQVASIQFCFGGAGGDNALLLRPGLDQVLPVQDHASADQLS